MQEIQRVRPLLTGFSTPPLGWNTLSTVSPVILEQSNAKLNTINNVQSDSPSIVSVFLFVIVVRVGGAQGLHFGSALSFILQIAD